jgi:transposase
LDGGGEGRNRGGEPGAGGCGKLDRLRHGLHRNQLYAWRRELRAEAVAVAGVAMPEFVPIVAEHRADAGAAAIEIAVGDAVVRARPGVDLAFLGDIIRLLKATA